MPHGTRGVIWRFYAANDGNDKRKGMKLVTKAGVSGAHIPPNALHRFEPRAHKCEYSSRNRDAHRRLPFEVLFNLPETIVKRA